MVGGAIFSASASAKGRDVFKVCKHGCKYSSVQKAVDKVKKGSKSMVKIKPGTYHEGVILSGHRYDKLIITGTTKPKKTILDGKNARIQGQPRPERHRRRQRRRPEDQEAVGQELPDQRPLRPRRPRDHCHGFAMDKDLASFNGSYGLFAKHCTGGKITNSKGWGQGDSAIYIGETPPQDKPKWTEIDHDKVYENVLGYSGTNSKYVDIHDSMFYNNGAGVVPEHARLRDVPAQRRREDPEQRHLLEQLQLLPAELAGADGLRRAREDRRRTINYPTGVGVVLFGSDGWLVKNNNIFGNFMWGAAAFSDPFNSARRSTRTTSFVDNKMGTNGTDTNQSDFFNDGSGKGNCFKGNASSSVRRQPDRVAPAGVPVSGLSRAEQRRHRDQPG